MPVNFDDFAPTEEEVRRTGSSGGPSWSELFQMHPEGGGPAGGRDNALFRLVAFLRAKSVPYEFGLEMAQTFNRRYLRPSLPEDAVEEKVSRAWAAWADGGIADETPETLKPQKEERDLRFLTFEEMEEEEKKAGAQSWQVEGGIPKQGLVYITGAPSGGKSWVALDLLRAAARGDLWIGKYPVVQTKCLYIDEEMGVGKALPRLRKLGIGREDSPWFRYTNKAGLRIDSPADLEKTRALIEAEGIGMVFVDTLTRVHGFDENDNSQMRKVFEKFQILIKAGATIIVLHHDRKGGQGMSSVGHDRSRGAGEIVAAADMVFGIEKHSGYYRMVPTKARLLSDDQAIACDFEIADLDDHTRVELRPVDSEQKSERKLDAISAEILTALRDAGEMNTRAICDAVEGSTEAIVAALKRMVDQGLVNVETGANRAKLYSPAPGSQF
jgi:hypothetical protein